jgi:hypothetical protein
MMSHQKGLRLVCAAIGVAVLPAFNGYVFLIDHFHAPAWPSFLVFLLCPPVLFVNFLAADAGDDVYLYTGLAIAALFNGGVYAMVGPAFWRLMKSIKESVFG